MKKLSTNYSIQLNQNNIEKKYNILKLIESFACSLNMNNLMSLYHSSPSQFISSVDVTLPNKASSFIFLMRILQKQTTTKIFHWQERQKQLILKGVCNSMQLIILGFDFPPLLLIQPLTLTSTPPQPNPSGTKNIFTQLGTGLCFAWNYS